MTGTPRRTGGARSGAGGEFALKPDSVRDYLEGLSKAGILSAEKPAEPRVGAATRYLLVKDVGREAPRVRPDGTEVTGGRGRENLWRTMRILSGAWTPRDLAIAAATEEHPVAEEEAKTYVRYLHHAGYLTCVQPAKKDAPTASQAYYRLLPGKNTGPKPPQVQRVKAVYDPNLERVVWSSAGLEGEA